MMNETGIPGGIDAAAYLNGWAKRVEEELDRLVPKSSSLLRSSRLCAIAFSQGVSACAPCFAWLDVKPSVGTLNGFCPLLAPSNAFIPIL